MPNHRSHCDVVVFLYIVNFCIRDRELFTASTIGFSSFDGRQKKIVASTLCTETFCSLYVSSLCVQSIFYLMSFQFPFCKVKCAHVPY